MRLRRPRLLVCGAFFSKFLIRASPISSSSVPVPADPSPGDRRRSGEPELLPDEPDGTRPHADDSLALLPAILGEAPPPKKCKVEDDGPYRRKLAARKAELLRDGNRRQFSSKKFPEHELFLNPLFYTDVNAAAQIITGWEVARQLQEEFGGTDSLVVPSSEAQKELSRGVKRAAPLGSGRIAERKRRELAASASIVPPPGGGGGLETLVERVVNGVDALPPDEFRKLVSHLERLQTELDRVKDVKAASSGRPGHAPIKPRLLQVGSTTISKRVTEKSVFFKIIHHMRQSQVVVIIFSSFIFTPLPSCALCV